MPKARQIWKTSKVQVCVNFERPGRMTELLLRDRADFFELAKNFGNSAFW